MALLHVLAKRLHVFPGASYLHQPVKIIVNTTGIRLVDFDHRQEILVGHEHFIFMVEQTGEKDAASQVLLELTRRREQLLDRGRLLLVVSPLHRRRFLRVLGPPYVREQSIQLLQPTGKPWHPAIDVSPT